MRQYVRRAPCFVALLLFAIAVAIQPASGQTLLFDDFTRWTANSAFLDSLAAATSSPAGTYVNPKTTFIGADGLQMSGLTKDYTLTGLQSLATFTPPFTVVAKVKPIQGTANPFAIYIVSADLTQYLTLHANVSPVYEGFWVDAQNVDHLYNLGEQFSPSFVPQMGTQYKVVIDVNASGLGTVNVYSAGKTTRYFLWLAGGNRAILPGDRPENRPGADGLTGC